MRAPGRIEVMPLWLVRLRARAPRLAVCLTAAILSVAGLRSMVAPHETTTHPVASVAPLDVVAEGLAQSFARAYLSWDPVRPEIRDAKLAAFGSAFDATFGATGSG